MRAASTLRPALVLALALTGCTSARDLSPGTGEHPAGWADPTSPAFHAIWLRANLDVLTTCQTCHGENFEGGPVGVPCTSAGCHTQPGGPEFCGTCHGSTAGPLPSTGADGVVWGEAEQAGIAFRRCGRVLLGLGDPAGSEADRVSAIWRLRDLAQQEGLDPAIWRAGPALLNVYGDIGLTALPLGADGLPLPEAETETPTSDQYLVCMAERDLSALLPLLPGLALADAAA